MLLDVAFGVALILLGAYGLYVALALGTEDDRWSGERSMERYLAIGYRSDPLPKSRARRVLEAAAGLSLVVAGAWWILSR